MGDVERFAATHWGRRPLHHRTGDSFSDLLTLADVDELVSTVLRRPALRVVRDGRNLPMSDYCSTARIGSRVLDDVADPAKLADAYNAGGTVVLNALHRTWAPLSRFAMALEREVSHPIQVNAYLSPPNATGLAAHADGHDVMVIQLAGQKEWWIDGCGDLSVAVGDILYVPAGTRHRATTAGTNSLHLTVGLMSVTYRQVVQRLVRTLDDLDRPLPLGFADTAVFHDELSSALRTTAQRLCDADVGDVVESECVRRRAGRRREGRFLDAVEADLIDAHSVVRRRQPARLTSAPHDRVALHVEDRVITLPAGTRPALEQLDAGDPVAVDRLRGLDAPSRLVVARRLVAEGWLTRA